MQDTTIKIEKATYTVSREFSESRSLSDLLLDKLLQQPTLVAKPHTSQTMPKI